MTMHNFQNHLQGDEKLLWIGRPGQGLFFSASDFLVVPFGLFWCGFVIFWESLVFADPNASLGMKVFAECFS